MEELAELNLDNLVKLSAKSWFLGITGYSCPYRGDTLKEDLERFDVTCISGSALWHVYYRGDGWVDAYLSWGALCLILAETLRRDRVRGYWLGRWLAELDALSREHCRHDDA